LSTNVDQLANNTVKVIYALLDPLLEALAADKIDDEAFMPVDEEHERVLNYNAKVVNGAFVSGARLSQLRRHRANPARSRQAGLDRPGQLHEGRPG